MPVRPASRIAYSQAIATMIRINTKNKPFIITISLLPQSAGLCNYYIIEAVLLKFFRLASTVIRNVVAELEREVVLWRD